MPAPTAHIQIGALPNSIGVCPLDGRPVERFPFAAVVSTRGSEVFQVCSDCAESKIGKGTTALIRTLNLTLASLSTAAPGARAALITAVRPWLLDAMGGTLDAIVVDLIASPAAT